MRKPFRSLRPVAIALSAGAAASLLGTLAMAMASASANRISWAASAVVVGAGAGAAVFVSSLAVAIIPWRWRLRSVVAILAAAGATAATVGSLGFRNVSLMSDGVQAGCYVGLGQCVRTRIAKMPLLLRSGPVQGHPVVHVILWDVTAAERSVILDSESHVSQLGQPLLETYYGVAPAIGDGYWAKPGVPDRWLSSRHEQRLSPVDLATIVRQASQAEGWADTPDAQYWFASSLTAIQMGIGQAACGDHTHVPGISGVLVRLPFGSCTLPSGRPSLESPVECRPLAEIHPFMNAPQTIEAGIDLFVGHEFAEAATDPSNGWTVLVSSRCGGDVLLEIADVCEPDGTFISAPEYRTRAGWQPSLLEPPNRGHPARCVDPTRPNEAHGSATYP